jgi:HEAT repeat protein
MNRRQLRRLVREGSMEQLEEALETIDDAKIRAAIIRGIEQRPELDAAPALIASLGPLEPREIRVLAARALRRFPAQAALGELAGMLRDGAPDERLAAIDGLTNIDGEDATTAIVFAINDERAAIAVAATRALLRRGTPDDHDALEEAIAGTSGERHDGLRAVVDKWG